MATFLNSDSIDIVLNKSKEVSLKYGKHSEWLI